MSTDFIHLHNHTDYSLLDGAASCSALIEKAKNLGMKGLAITDHGNMFGAVEFYDTMRKAGIKPILGMEAYIVDDVKKNKEDKIREKYHLVLLVKNEEG